MWALQRLRKLLTTEYGQSININRLLGDSEGEARSMVSPAETILLLYLIRSFFFKKRVILLVTVPITCCHILSITVSVFNALIAFDDVWCD